VSELHRLEMVALVAQWIELLRKIGGLGNLTEEEANQYHGDMQLARQSTNGYNRARYEAQIELGLELDRVGF
jgi:hypothetical protein